MLIAAAAVQLCHSRVGVLGTVLPVALVSAGGAAYVYLALLPGAVRVEMTATVSRPTVARGLSGPASEASVALLVRNVANRALVLTSDSTTAAQGTATRSAALPAAVGRPDVVLALKRGAGESDDASKPGGVSTAYAIAGAPGCVLRPGEQAQIVLRFSPVWERWRAERGSRAGAWAATLGDAAGAVMASVNLTYWPRLDSRTGLRSYMPLAATPPLMNVGGNPKSFCQSVVSSTPAKWPPDEWPLM